MDNTKDTWRPGWTVDITEEPRKPRKRTRTPRPRGHSSRSDAFARQRSRTAQRAQERRDQARAEANRRRANRNYSAKGKTITVQARLVREAQRPINRALLSRFTWAARLHPWLRVASTLYDIHSMFNAEEIHGYGYDWVGGPQGWTLRHTCSSQGSTILYGGLHSPSSPVYPCVGQASNGNPANFQSWWTRMALGSIRWVPILQAYRSFKSQEWIRPASEAGKPLVIRDPGPFYWPENPPFSEPDIGPVPWDLAAEQTQAPSPMLGRTASNGDKSPPRRRRHDWSPPRKNEREVKAKVPKWFAQIAKQGINVTEYYDMIDILWENLPDDLQYSGPRTGRASRTAQNPGARYQNVQDKLKLVMKHWDQIDWNQAIPAMVLNHYADEFIGYVNSRADFVRDRAGGVGWGQITSGSWLHGPG